MGNNSKVRNYEKDILNKSLSYSLAIYIRMMSKLFSGFFIAKFLGPTIYGLKNAFDLSLSYEAYSDLGTFSALNREVPYFRGENDTKKVNAALNSIFAVNIIYAAAASVILISISKYLKFIGYESKYVDFMFFLGIIIFVTKVRAFFQTKLKSEMKFFLLSRIEIIYGLSFSVLGVVLSYLYGFRGLLIGMLIANLLCIIFILFKERQIPKLSISFQMYWHLLKIGIPLMILFFLIMLLACANRTLIIALISQEALGYFGIAMVAVNIVALIPGVIHNVTLAPLMEKLGAEKDKSRIRHFFTEPAILMAYTLPILIVFLYYFIHLPIDYYLNKYIPAISVVKILVAGSFFQAVASPALSVSLGLNKQTKLIFVVAPIVLLNIGLNFAFIKLGWGIEGAALATSITYFIYFFIMVFFASNLLGGGIKEYLNTSMLILTPFLYSTIIVIIIESYLRLTVTNIWNDIMYTSLQFCTFTVVYSLIFFKIRKHSAFVKLFDNMPLFHTIQNKLRFCLPEQTR
jgi:O-antigen/teichoic acid export membrane protein